VNDEPCSILLVDPSSVVDWISDLYQRVTTSYVHASTRHKRTSTELVLSECSIKMSSKVGLNLKLGRCSAWHRNLVVVPMPAKPAALAHDNTVKS